jgi:C1A family cysteine protease
MSDSKVKWLPRLLAVAIVVLLLAVFAGQRSVTLGSATPRYAYGDNPVDPATYEQYLRRLPLRAYDLPTAYDARTEGIVTPPKDQAACGGCWAFASAGAFESHLLDAGLAFDPTDLSEQQQLSCNTDMSGCCSGNLTAPQYWETRGPVYDPCFPFGDGGTSCPPNSNVPCSNGDLCPQLPYRVTNFYTVAADQFRESLYTDGPSYWRFDVYSDFQPWYNSAISGTVYVNDPNSTDTGQGHAVLIIGWDDAKSAYLMKNSWGATSGPQGDGTFWIAYSGHGHDLGFAMSNFDVVSVNEPPVADAGGPYSGDEGSTVSFDGSGSSDPNGDVLSYAWTFGDGATGTGVAPTHTYDDNAIYTVCLTVTDPGGLSDEDCTTADIANVPPVAAFIVPVQVDEGDVFPLYLANPYDPSAADTAAGFEYDFSCGDGYDGWSSDDFAFCQTYDNGILDVAGKIRDKDGGVTEYTAQVIVGNLPPAVSVDVVSQIIQYSDYICDVTFTATDVASDTLTATPDALPDSLDLIAQGCVLSGDGIWQTCTWTLEGTIDEPPGSYVVTVTVADEDGGAASAATTISVEPEDAVLWLDPDNPKTVPVDLPLGDSPVFTLTAYVQELSPDEAICGADPGDLLDAQVALTLVPVGPGAPITSVCTPVEVNGSGYDAVLTVACTFDNVPVNTYWVQGAFSGGSYTGAPVEDLIIVYDASLGFSTGGGWFYWPGTGEMTNFGYTIKYNGKVPRIQGSLVLIRHMPDGTIYRIKSTHMLGLALGTSAAARHNVDGGPSLMGNQTIGWAAFVGTANYMEPGWSEPVGGYRFILYAEDRNEPGAGYDQFWIELQDGQGNPVPAMTMARPALGNTVALEGGNITVPHNRVGAR